MRALSINDTNVLKGIALLLLLCHHCFYPGEPYDDIILFGHPVVQNIGEFSKLCVAIFVFLSGYGLTIQTMAKGGIGNVLAFYRRRYVKLMINYWLIWLIFVPIGVFFFHRTFPHLNNRASGLAEVLGVDASPNTIDELLSGEKLITIAENENRHNIQYQYR